MLKSCSHTRLSLNIRGVPGFAPLVAYATTRAVPSVPHTQAQSTPQPDVRRRSSRAARPDLVENDARVSARYMPPIECSAKEERRSGVGRSNLLTTDPAADERQGLARRRDQTKRVLQVHVRTARRIISARSALDSGPAAPGGAEAVFGAAGPPAPHSPSSAASSPGPPRPRFVGPLR